MTYNRNHNHLTTTQKVIISITPCGRPMCNHAICRAHRAWVSWREAQFEENQPQQSQQLSPQAFYESINL